MNYCQSWQEPIQDITEEEIIAENENPCYSCQFPEIQAEIERMLNV